MINNNDFLDKLEKQVLQNCKEEKDTSEKARKNKINIPTGPIDLYYTLEELPSSQHRAGLAGLVLIINWLKEKNGIEGICEINNLTENGLSLRLDLKGLKLLFDTIYGASSEERESPTKWKDNKKKDIEPIHEEIRDIVDKNGKIKKKTFYFYPEIVPDGAFLNEWDGSSTKCWIKLWRDTIWNIIRGIPKQRLPYICRANNKQNNDINETWESLHKNFSVNLSSSYLLGANAHNAENIDFKDSAKFHFLLNFFPFVMQIYVPRIINKEKEEYNGYVIVIPDVANIITFCEDFKCISICKSEEDNKLINSRPGGSIIDFTIEGGLDFFRLKKQIQQKETNKITIDSIYGVDIFHMIKDGNSIKILNTCRVESDDSIIDEYLRVRRIFWSSLFRRQYICNLIAKNPWFHNFNKLFSTLSINNFITPPKNNKDYENYKKIVDKFSHDSRLQFKTMTETNEISVEAIIYKMIGTYLKVKMERKPNSCREDIARDAFFACRSRTGADFVKYFTETICSVPHHIKESDYNLISKHLLSENDRIIVRNLTLLALSARS